MTTLNPGDVITDHDPDAVKALGKLPVYSTAIDADGDVWRLNITRGLFMRPSWHYMRDNTPSPSTWDLVEQFGPITVHSIPGRKP